MTKYQKLVRYACYAGVIYSDNDGDKHFISARRVAELYRVNPKECVFININGNPRHKLAGYYPPLKELRPRADGNYDLKN